MDGVDERPRRDAARGLVAAHARPACPRPQRRRQPSRVAGAVPAQIRRTRLRGAHRAGRCVVAKRWTDVTQTCRAGVAIAPKAPYARELHEVNGGFLMGGLTW